MEKDVMKRATINYELFASERERKIQEISSELKRATINYEFFASERERKIQEINKELISTQKNLKMSNSSTTKLDHILTMGQSSKNGLGYTSVTSDVATSSKIVLVKAAPK